MRAAAVALPIHAHTHMHAVETLYKNYSAHTSWCTNTCAPLCLQVTLNVQDDETTARIVKGRLERTTLGQVCVGGGGFGALRLSSWRSLPLPLPALHPSADLRVGVCGDWQALGTRGGAHRHGGHPGAATGAVMGGGGRGGGASVLPSASSAGGPPRTFPPPHPTTTTTTTGPVALT